MDLSILFIGFCFFYQAHDEDSGADKANGDASGAWRLELERAHGEWLTTDTVDGAAIVRRANGEPIEVVIGAAIDDESNGAGWIDVAIGDEIIRDEISGEETSGDETSGDEISDEETIGDTECEISGDGAKIGELATISGLAAAIATTVANKTICK